MKKNIFFTLALLITSFVFSSQSLASWGNWSPLLENYGSTYCLHSNGEATNFSMAKLEVWSAGGPYKDKFMTLLKGSSAWAVVPQILYTNDKLRKDNPNRPYQLMQPHRTPIQQWSRWFMGFHHAKAGELFACRIKPY
ncbi:MAG: hypothetical protein ACRBCS_03820 [Cellvibrionaceae bacterium]